MHRIVQPFTRFFSILFLAFVLSGCQEAIDRANSFLQAAQGDLQLKRAIVLSADTIAGINNDTPPDAVLSLTQADLQSMEAELQAALAGTKAAIENDVTINWVNLVFGNQTLSAEINVSKPVKRASITGTVQASAFVAAAPDGLYWNLYLDGFQITDIDGRFGFINRITQWAINQANIFTGVMNVILDEAVNSDPEKALFVSVTQDKLISQNLANLSDGDFDLADHNLELALDSEMLAIVITPDGLRLVSDLEFRKPADVQIEAPRFPSESELIRISEEGAALQLASYQQTVEEWLSISNPLTEDVYEPVTLEVLKGSRTGVIIAGDLLSQALAVATSDVIRGSLAFAEADQSASDISFSIGRRQCEGYFAACDNKNFCEGNRCREKVTETYKTACKLQCGFSTGFWGLLVPKLCDGLCDATRDVVRDVASPSCDAFRLASKVHGDLLCKVAKEVDHATCNLGENVKKAACQIEQEARRFYEKNPVAQVKTDSSFNGAVALSFESLSLAPDLTTVSVQVSAQGQGEAKVSIDYDRKNYTTALLLPGISLGAGCVVDWKEGVTSRITASIQQRTLLFDATWSNDDEGSLVINLTQAKEETALLDLDPAPIPALFVGKPHVTLNCPLMAVGAVGFGTYEALFSEQEARVLFPLITGNDYPAKIKNLSFDARIEPIRVCDPDDEECQSPLLTLNPSRDGSNIVFASQ